MFKEPGHNTRRAQAAHDREISLRKVLDKPLKHDVNWWRDMPICLPAKAGELRFFDGPIVGRKAEMVVHDEVRLQVEPMFVQDGAPVPAPSPIPTRRVPADWKQVYHDPLRNRYVDERGKKHILDSDIADAVNIANAVGPLNQAMSEAYTRTGYTPTYNYASGHPWFNGVKEFMASKGWDYTGGGYFSAVFAKGDLVIKIGMKSEDSCAAYYAWVRDNPGLPGLPDLYHIERFGPVSYTVVMRKYRGVNCMDTANRIKHGQVPGVSDTYNRIKAFFQGVAEMDMHGENIMRCMDTDELIITDPVSFKAGAKH